jgi:phosphoglycolate phosphatase-like HAD superfamily hydrolase
MESHLDNPIGQENTSQPAWLAGAVADAYKLPGVKELGDAADSVGNFAKDHWKEITGVGVAVVAGTAFVVGRRYGLGGLTTLLKGGDEAAAFGKNFGASQGAVARLKNVDHFVFDMDRTLVDHDGALKVLQSTMTDGLAKSSGLSREFVSDALAETTRRLDSPYFFNRLDKIQPLQDKFPGIDLNRQFADVAASSKQAYHDALKAKPETVELLDLLRSQGKGVHVFTAGTPTRALEKLQGAGLLNRVDRIYTSGANAFEDSGAAGLMTSANSPVKLFALPEAAKKSGSGYEFIANDLKTRGSRMAMTGDHPVEDVANAKAHDYVTAIANWYRQAKLVAQPDLELASPSQFTSLLKSKVFKS